MLDNTVKKKFVFTWKDHVVNESGESEPKEMTEQEALDYFRSLLDCSFSPFLTRNYYEVK